MVINRSKFQETKSEFSVVSYTVTVTFCPQHKSFKLKVYTQEVENKHLKFFAVFWVYQVKMVKVMDISVPIIFSFDRWYIQKTIQGICTTTCKTLNNDSVLQSQKFVFSKNRMRELRKVFNIIQHISDCCSVFFDVPHYKDIFWMHFSNGQIKMAHQCIIIVVVWHYLLTVHQGTE